MSNLVFRSLTITNFKSFSGRIQFKLDRGPGLFYVSGKNKLDPDMGANGVGKTTLWDALTWCLFGKTGRDNRPGNAVVPWGNGKNQTRVELSFSAMGQNYELVRCKNPNNLMLFEDSVERIIEQSEISKIIGMSEEMFRRTVVLAQFGSLFLDLKPEAQSQMFNEALRLDVWLDASERANFEYKDWSKTIEGTKLIIADNEGRLSEIKQQIKDTKTASEAFDSNREERLDKMQREFASLPKASFNKKELEDLQEEQHKLKKVYDTTIRQRERIQPVLERIQADIKKYSKAKDICPECKQEVSSKHIKDKVTSLKKELENIEHEIAQLQQPLNNLEKELENIDIHLATLHRSQERAWKLEAPRTRLAASIEALEKETNHYERTLEKLRQTRGQLKEDLTKHDTALETYQGLMGTAEYWRDAFKEIRLSLIDQVLTELGMASTAHAEALGLEGWRIEFKTERETKAGNVSVVFNVLLYPPDQDEPMKFESYSGGESQRWQLAVAFGLSEIVLARAGVQPSLEVLDEPTRGMSSEGIEHLLEHLSERAQELKRTIFITEHHSLERGQFMGTITVVKDKHGSTIVEG